MLPLQQVTVAAAVLVVVAAAVAGDELEVVPVVPRCKQTVLLKLLLMHLLVVVLLEDVLDELDRGRMRSHLCRAGLAIAVAGRNPHVADVVVVVFALGLGLTAAVGRRQTLAVRGRRSPRRNPVAGNNSGGGEPVSWDQGRHKGRPVLLGRRRQRPVSLVVELHGRLEPRRRQRRDASMS